ncbi:MAG TPA: hypothetical protein VFP22_00580 [Candidatus Limnocylindrales bacterium]|nr:hypothetical protein [Candidatus Limnocylindrales bacterium]
MTQNPTTERIAYLRDVADRWDRGRASTDEVAGVMDGLPRLLDAVEARATAPAGLREAASEVIAAFDARPDTDERDHPEGLTKEQVELAWFLWDIRQMNALDALRDRLAASGETE